MVRRNNHITRAIQITFGDERLSVYQCPGPKDQGIFIYLAVNSKIFIAFIKPCKINI